jgi:predicted  nucleic acid-binding Zn-ribbon protein
MLEVIEKLLILQADDQKARQYERELEALPRQRQVIKEKFLSAQGAFEKSTTGLKQNEVDRKKVDLDIQTKTAAIQKYKQQMLQTRKNEEYQALQKEIAAGESAVGDYETRQLELMEQADVLQAEVAKAKAELDTIRTRLEAEAKDLVAHEANLKKGIENLKARRAALVPKIDPDDLGIYERIFGKKGDAAIVPLNHDVCGGCHMKVTATTSGNTKAGTSMVHCENCGRILYQDW